MTRDVSRKKFEMTQSLLGVGDNNGMLFLIKHSRPDIANTVRELTKVLDGASPAAFKELKRVIKYVLDTEKLGLKIQPEVENGRGKWTMVTYLDSDYATDPKNSLSVSGFVL